MTTKRDIEAIPQNPADNAGSLGKIPQAPSVGDGWQPCSKKCGFGCTQAAYDRAVREADALATRMGPGWVTRVWENAGWNYSVRNAFTTITPNRKGGGSITGNWTVSGYTAWIEPDKSRQFIESADTPEDALGFAVQNARTAITRIEQALSALYHHEVQS